MKGTLIIATVLVALLLPTTAHAHRLSGHPKTLQGKLTLAKRQYSHDMQETYLHSNSYGIWRRLDSHALWVDADLAYVGFLKHQIVVEQQRKTAVAMPNWLVNAFLCIHHYEGSWTDPNPPYYGGLQMDYGFMSTYGPQYLARYGTADHWPPSIQIAVAIRAYNSGRGFAPWPNTAHSCGLL